MMKTAPFIALQKIQINGTLAGLLLSVSLRQYYRNEGKQNLEMVYTFPLGYNAELLGMNAEIGGKRLQAAVFERKTAREKYEDAVVDGDSPILVEKSADGLYTANLGNIAAGEEAVIEIRYAQLLRFEQGHIRVTIPTVIAQRYGDASTVLAPHESAAPDIAAEYPMTLRLDLSTEFAQAETASPSHHIVTQRTETGVSVRTGGKLDRDFVLTLSQLTGTSFAQFAPDGEQFMAVASFCPKFSETKPLPAALKILVDCSGSMTGSSIEAAKKALHLIMKELNETDYVSYSRFGSHVQRVIETLQPCSAGTLRQLEREIQATDANMGGTEMEAALLDTFKIGQSFIGKRKNAASDSVPPPFVLLITDGEIWNTDNVIAQCLQSKHRVFAVGVGSSPAENLLRQSAEKTGGACEFVAPNEDAADAILRMFHRMRGSAVQDTKVDWTIKPVWQSAIPPYLYSGETLHVAALFDKPPAEPPQLTWTCSGRTEKDAVSTWTKTENADVVRLGGAKRLLEAKQKDTLPLALRYQLVCGETAMFLVYERADKLSALPELHQIPQMHAAGWGGSDDFACYELASACCCEKHIVMKSMACAPQGRKCCQPEGRFSNNIKTFMGFRDSHDVSFTDPVDRSDEELFIAEILNATASCVNVEETKQRIAECFHQHAPDALRTFLDQEHREHGTDPDVILAVAMQEFCRRCSVKPNHSVKQWLRVVLKNVPAIVKRNIIQRYDHHGGVMFVE